MKKLLASIFLAATLTFTAAPDVFAVTTSKTTTETPAMQQETEAVAPDTHTAQAQTTESEGEEDVGVAGMFGLNWKLFLAQLVNFGIVLFVLWKWVFKPVTSGMEARTKKIEESLANADRITEEKASFEQWQKQEMAKARQEAVTIINEAKNTAMATRDEILTQTKAEQEQMISKAKEQLEKEKISAISEAKSQIAELVVASTEKLITAKLDPKQDAKIIKQSLEGLE